jgi:hypothetical protein
MSGAEARCAVMRATRVRTRKSRMHRVSWCRMRYRAVTGDPNRASNSAAPTVISEQWTGRCYQQCRYAEYCKKLGYPHHHALFIRGQRGTTIFPLSFKIEAHIGFHANYSSLLPRLLRCLPLPVAPFHRQASWPPYQCECLRRAPSIGNNQLRRLRGVFELPAPPMMRDKAIALPRAG